MIYCTKCGKQNSESAKFCTGCGIAISANVLIRTEKAISEDYRSPEKKKNKFAVIIIGVVAMLALGSGVYFIFFNKKKEDDSAIKDKNEAIDVTTIEPPSSKTESTSPISTTASSYTDMNGLLVHRSDCFVIITGSFANEAYARDFAVNMKNEGYQNTGYLWIPDYPSLSGKQFYATFIGPYQTYSDCENNLRTLKKTGRFWYGIKVSYENTRVEIR